MNLDVSVPSSSGKVYFHDTLEKLVRDTDFFQGINKEIVLLSLKKIQRIDAGVTLIEENSRSCDAFYLLLNGTIGIYKQEEKIAEINGVQAFGEMGFLNGKRGATVRTEKTSHIIQMSKAFISSLDPETRSTLHFNLAREVANKIHETNEENARLRQKLNKTIQSTKAHTTETLQRIIQNL